MCQSEDTFDVDLPRASDPHVKPQPRRLLLTFENERDFLVAMPMILFKPKGLLIWDADERAVLTQVLIGTFLQVVVSFPPVPVAWFQTGRNYEQVLESIKEGYDAANWIDWSLVEVGCRVRLQIEPHTGKERAVMWGLAFP